MILNKGARVSVLLTSVSILLFHLSGCGDFYPENPYLPENDGPSETGEAAGYWRDVLAADAGYPPNVYLTENIEFHPGRVGSARISSSPEYYNAEGYPLDSVKNGACGPPEGTAAVFSSAGDMTVLGSGGWASWSFDPAWVIVDGPGDDFVTFANHNVLYGDPDGSWNELAHVYASEDGINWYVSAAEKYTAHPAPGNASDGYFWSEADDLHGNNHSWANFRKDVTAEELDLSSGTYKPVISVGGAALYVSKYFKPDDPYLGGDRFDLAVFVHTEPAGLQNGNSWPADGKMRYLKIADDPAILDGQDWNPEWMTGARIMAAMGINVEKAQ